MSYDENDQNEGINEIIKGFEMFDVENKGIINPFELKETIEEMNLENKNPFLYKLVCIMCSRKDIKSKGGITSEEFISILKDKLSDAESKQGIKTIFDVFSDSDNKVAIPTFYQVAREVGDEEGAEEIRDLVQKSKTGGKEIDYDEFYDIMKEKIPRNKYKYNQYSYKSNKSSNKSKESNHNEYEVEKRGDDQGKTKRYHYKLDKNEKYKKIIDNQNFYPNIKNVNDSNDNYSGEAEQNEVKRYHRKNRYNNITNAGKFKYQK